jgi:hypothetical protein
MKRSGYPFALGYRNIKALLSHYAPSIDVFSAELQKHLKAFKLPFDKSLAYKINNNSVSFLYGNGAIYDYDVEGVFTEKDNQELCSLVCRALSQGLKAAGSNVRTTHVGTVKMKFVY